MSDSKRPKFNPENAAEAQAAAEEIMAQQSGGASVDRAALAKKAEELIAKANALLAQIGDDINTSDPNQLEIDREVRQAINELNEVYVSNAQPDHAYAWIFRDPHNEFGGRYVRKMQALGWERVAGEMPEAKEHKNVVGERVVADCMLMRIRLDRKMLLEKRDALLREAQQAGITARVYELAERAGTRVYDKLPGFIEEALTSEANNRRQGALNRFHRMNQGGKLDRMLKTGTIPGIPSPGAGGR